MKKFLVASMAMVAVGAAQAGTVVCSGTVQYLSFHAPDGFMLQLSSMNAPVFFCSPEKTHAVQGTSYTTGANTCKQLYATFLAARMAGTTVQGMYFDGDDAPATCNGWGAWKSAVIRHYTL